MAHRSRIAHPMFVPAASSRRRGFTIIEIAIVLGIAAIFAAMALPAVDFNRYRMDASARFVQNKMLWAQSRAVQRNMQMLVEIAYDRNQLRIVDDSTANGLYTAGETYLYTTLPEGMKFVTPPSTIDGQATTYATGAGISLDGSYPTLIFYPNGSSSGDAVVYLGSPKGRTSDNRAIKISGATSKMYFYRMRADGTWSLSEM